jgi:hypothetical protein
MRKITLFFLSLCFLPFQAHAQGAAPELFGVHEIVVEFAKFPQAKASETCGLTREEIAADIMRGFAGSPIPAVSVVDAKPPSLGVARIELVPEISSRSDETLNCTSWISLSAESRANTIISPVTTLRSITAVYWRQHTIATSSEAAHPKTVDDIIQRMAAQFAQQYLADQPPDTLK